MKKALPLLTGDVLILYNHSIADDAFGAVLVDGFYSVFVDIADVGS